MDRNKLKRLQSRIQEEDQEDYPNTSRIHLLRTFGEECYVKREDELGFSISGTKFRKYRMLIPYLKRGNKRIVVIGGPFSNHILGVTQLLIENGLEPILLLKGPPAVLPEYGNFRFLQTLVAASSIHWVAKENWHEIETIAHKFAPAQILPEGSTLFRAFLGALTLPLDIIRNEQEAGFEFDEVYFEAGTGWSAAALLLGFAYVGKQTKCPLLLLADNEEIFRKRLQELHVEFEKWIGEKCPFPERFTCEHSSLSPSFGSTNAAVFDFIVQTARKEGFFLDPIYSAKLFYHAKQKKPSGRSLIVHSGGALTLTGFQDRLR